jgi:hypothetical protein
MHTHDIVHLIRLNVRGKVLRGRAAGRKVGLPSRRSLMSRGGERWFAVAYDGEVVKDVGWWVLGMSVEGRVFVVLELWC